MKQQVRLDNDLVRFVLFVCVTTVSVVPHKTSANDLIPPDRIIVKKAERKLLLIKDDEILKSYEISLGKNPVGQKQQRGDFRTPEGSYILDWRNPNSRFYRSIHISYPNEDDKMRAKQLGVPAGGDIMIHGLPNIIGPLIYRVKGRDWTAGCIALRNKEMEEVWGVVADNTPIDILP